MLQQIGISVYRMNRQWLVSILTLFLLLIAPGVLFAQEGLSDAEIIARYANIPAGRTDDGGFVLGDPEAPVTIVEFSDYLCSHCQAYETTVEQVITNLVMTGKARFEYRTFITISAVYSPLTAQIAECAETVQSGMFWPAHDILYQITGSGEFTEEIASDVAKRLDLDGDAMAACMKNAIQYLVDYDVANDVGISGTPAVMVREEDGRLRWLAVGEQTLNRGGVPYATLEAFVNGDESVTTTLPDGLLNDKMLRDTSLVDESPCGAPCWNGIKPGETRWDEAVEILQNDPTLTNIQIQTAEDSAAVQAVWQPVDGEPCCQIISNDGETVDAILLFTAPDISLGEVIDKQGDPTYVAGTARSSKQAMADLIYPNVPMMLYVYIDGLETGTISESSEVIGVLYLTPDDMNGLIQASDLYGWKGYQSFQAYVASGFAEKP